MVQDVDLRPLVCWTVGWNPARRMDICLLLVLCVVSIGLCGG